jgi:methylmalonyl-CoA/ethylmalonyl-CoA epimerase
MRVVQVAQRAIDLDRATAFYSRLLGTEPSGVFDPPGLVFFDLDGVRLLLERGAPSAVIYLQVPDVDAALARLRADGARIIAEPVRIFQHSDGRLGPAGTDEYMAFFADSEGNSVGLVEQRDARQQPGATSPS